MNGFHFSKQSRARRLAAIALVAVVSVVQIERIHAAKHSPSMCCGSLPEMWVINTRCAPRCNNLERGFEMISYQRYDRCRGCFVNETRESFLAGEATMPTLFYIHGNSLKHKGAMKGFWDVYEKLRCCPGQKRLVCWSWPAERVFKTEGLRIREMIRKNLRIKYVYAEYQGYYLAKLVERMSLTQRVTLSGHSYGAITSAVALHLTGGGCVRGLTLASGAPVERANLRGAMISAAFDCDMLYPGHRYGQAFVAAEKIMSTFNPYDRTLRKWPRTSWRGCEALGRVGMNPAKLGQYRRKFCQVNCYPENRSSHYLGPHLKNPRFMSAYCCTAFGGINAGLPVVGTRVEINGTNPVETAPQAVSASAPEVASPAKLTISAKKEEEPTLAELSAEEPKANEATKKSGQEARSSTSPGRLRSGDLQAAQSRHSVRHFSRRNGILGSRR